MWCLLRVYRLIIVDFFPVGLVRCRVLHDRDIPKMYSINTKEYSSYICLMMLFAYSSHRGSFRFSVFIHLFKCFYVSNQMVCDILLQSVQSLSPYFAICFLQTTQKRDTTWLTCKGEIWEIFKWLRTVGLFLLPLFDIGEHRLWYNASLQCLHQGKYLFVYLWYDALLFPWYLHDVTCVKFILEFACFQGRKLSRNRLCCRLRHRRFNDNFRWRHWHWSWHYDRSRFSTRNAISLYNVLSRDLLSIEYRIYAPWFARKGEVRVTFVDS